MPKPNNFRFRSHASGSMYNHGSTHAESSRTTSRIDGNLETFWTICPYCYFVYEYSKLYQDCIFKCENVECKKVFHGVPMGAAPPDELVEKGKYFCPGFVVLSGGEGGADLWNPFSDLGSFRNGKKEKEVENVCVELSDDEMEGCGVGGSEQKSEKSKKWIEDVEVSFGDGVNEKDVKGDEGKVYIVGEKNVEGAENEEGFSGRKVYRTRIKTSVPRSSRKFMGKGVRVKRNEVLPMQDVRKGGRKEDGESWGCGGGNMSKVMNVRTEAGSLEYNMGDDDIFVGLQDIVV